MLIYLDTSNLLNVVDGKFGRSADVLASLPNEHDFALSTTHLFDASGARESTRRRLFRLMMEWPRAQWIAPAHGLRAQEMVQFIASQFPQFQFQVQPFTCAPEWSEDEYATAEGVQQQLTAGLKLFAYAKQKAKSIPAGAQLSQAALREAKAKIQSGAVLDLDSQAEAIARLVVQDDEAIPFCVEDLLCGADGDATLLAGAGYGHAVERLRLDPNDLPARAMIKHYLQTSHARSLELGVVEHLDDHLWDYCIGFLPNFPAEMRPHLTPEQMKLLYRAWRTDPGLTPGVRIGTRVSQLIAGDRQSKERPSTTFDIEHLTALPYVDVLYADNAMQGYVAKAVRDLGLEGRVGECRRASEFLTAPAVKIACPELEPGPPPS